MQFLSEYNSQIQAFTVYGKKPTQNFLMYTFHGILFL